VKDSDLAAYAAMNMRTDEEKRLQKLANEEINRRKKAKDDDIEILPTSGRVESPPLSILYRPTSTKQLYEMVLLLDCANVDIRNQFTDLGKVRCGEIAMARISLGDES